MTLICGWIYFISSISVVHSQSVIESPHCPSSKQVCIEKATFNSAHALDGRYKWFNYSFLNLSCYYNQYTNTYIYPSIVTLDAVPRVRFQYFIKQNDEVIAKCNITSDAPVLSQCQWSLFDIHNNKWRVDTDIIVTECGDICAHGTAFEWIAFNKSHRTNVYECIMCKPVLYLYGWIDIESNSNTTIYSWKISENSNHGTQHVHGSCFCGMNFDSHYTFNINDCQYWERNDHSLSDMRVTECEHCVQLDPNSEMRRSYVLNGVSRDFTVGFDLNVAGFMIMLPDDASLVLKYSCRDANALFEDSTSINIRVSSLDTVYHSISESCDNAKSISIAFATINMTTAVYLDNVYIYHKKYHRQHNTRRSLLIGNETIFCNGSVTDTIADNPQPHMYRLTLTNTTDVTFSNCDSQTDLYLKVLTASSRVISEPYCSSGDGCRGCPDPAHQSHESFTIPMMAVGTYQIEIIAIDVGGDYQIDIDCAEPSGPNLFCNDSVTDTIPNFPRSHLYVFALMNTTDITFSDCDSQTDLYLKVLNVSSHVISDPYCGGGDGCGGCSNGVHESYTMQLSAGTYLIQVMAWNEGGDYQIDIDCAEPPERPGSNLFCNDSVTYTIPNFPQSHIYVFALTDTVDVTFSDCSSPTNLYLKVLNGSSHVISDPYCEGGNDCGGCSNADHVSYTMQLSAGTYQIQVMAWNDGGDYQVDIDCAEPPSHTPTESPSKMPTRSPLPDNRTYSPSQKPSYRPSNGGCFNTEAEFQKEVIPHRIYACSGIIKGGGFYGTDAQALCTDDYHVCDSAIEAKSLGLTAAICNNVAGGSESKFFGTKESSKDFYECTSDYPLSSGFNNAWGCGGAIFYDSACDETLTKLIKKDDDVTYQWWEFQSHWTEAASVSLKNAAGGGVLCCIGESKYTPYPDLYECVTDGSITSHYQGTSYSDHEENEAVEWEDIATDKYDANVADGDGLSSDAYDTLSGYRVLSGDTTSRIRFEPMLSENHTVISLCKYNGANKNTIFQTDNGDIFGFYEGRAGVAFENGWITDEFNHITDDWLLSAQTPYLYRGNGFSYTRDNGQGSTGYLGINYGNVSDEDSDWSCAEVIIIADKMLTLREIKCIENAINIKYNLALPNVGTPSPTLEPTNAPTDIPTLHPTRSPIECPYGTFKPTVDGDTCFSCGKNIGGFECLGKSVVNVQSGYWIAAKLDNRFVSLIDDKLASLSNYTISSIRCASGYCCNDRNGCDYFDAMQKGELCAEGCNVSSITCSACDNNLSELLNSNSCGVCRESKYSYFGALYVTSLIFSGLMIFVFSKPPNVWNQMKSKTEIEQVDWYRILIKDEQDIVKTLVLKVILYYYQAMTQILSTRNIVPLSQFESTLLSLANFEIPSSLGGSSGICFIANIQSGLHEILISYSFYVFLFFNAAVFAILSYNIRILASFKPFIKTGMISVVLMCAGPMLSTSFKLVACLSIEDFGYFHLYDSRKQCFGFFWIFGLIMILIICVVFVVFWYLVFTQSVLERDNESNRYRSLVNKYKSNVWFWEFVLFLRRLGIALLTSINYIASSIISIGLISFIVILFGLQARFNPFKYARANVLETISLFGLVSIIICVNFINAADEYHIYIMWYFTFLIAMPFLVVMAMVLRIIYRWCYFRKGGDQQKDVDVINKQQKQLHRIKERMPSSYKKWFDEVLKGTGDTHDDMDEGAMDDETGIVYDTMNETEIQAQDGKPKDDSISSSIDVDPGVPQRTNDSDHDGSDADTVPQHMNWKMKEKMKRHVQNQ